MKILKSLSALLILSIALSVGIMAQAPIRVVCIGNSITAGYGLGNSAVQAWPAQLNKKLGGEYSVLNCGASGTRMSKKQSSPYWQNSAYQTARNSDPQILIISLGTNDADQGLWPLIQPDFKADYSSMIDSFRLKGKNPVIYLVLPPPLFANSTQNTNIENGVIPIIKEISVEKKAYIIDYHTSMLGENSKFPDGVHPGPDGALMLSNISYNMISSKQVIVPYISINGGDQIQKDTVTLNVGDNLTFNPSPTDKGTWIWTDPKGIKTTDRNLTITGIQATQGGTYSAEYTDELGQRSIKNFMVSFFGCTPLVFTPYFQVGQNAWQNSTAVIINPGNKLTFGPQVSNSAENIWNWTGPNGFYNHSRQFSIDNIPNNQAGDYTAIFYNTDGCKSIAVFTVKVEGDLICPKLTPYINMSGESVWKNILYVATTSNASLKFGPNPPEGEWNWKGPAGYTANNRETALNNISTAKAGKYTGVYTNDAGCKDSLVFTIAVNCPTLTGKVNYKKLVSTTIVPSVFVNDTIVLTPTPTTGNWSWTGPNAFASSFQKDTINKVQLNQAGKYKAVYTDANFCRDSVTYTLTVKTATGIDIFEESGKSIFVPYPNPANDHIIIPSVSASTVITLLNSSGQIVKSAKSSVIGEYMFYLHDLKPGIYYIKTSNNSGKTYKFIKE